MFRQRGHLDIHVDRVCVSLLPESDWNEIGIQTKVAANVQLLFVYIFKSFMDEARTLSSNALIAVHKV